MFRLRSLVVFLAALLAVICLNAQVISTVTGTVVDPSGAAVPGASVSLRLAGSTAAMFTAKTSTSGTFAIASVQPNTYELTVEAQGFVTVRIGNLEVLPGRALDVPTVKLGLATTSTSVEISETGNTVQTTSSDVSTTITKSQIQDLPTMNRSPLGFLQTQAGINNARGNTTVDGQRSTFVNVTLDGVNIQDNFIRQNDLDFLPNLLLLDQVAEVTVTSANADASAGGGSSQVTFVTPSGTNTLHGAVYWSNRNKALAANSFFNNKAGTPKAALNQNQIGFRVGGPIIKNKLFFYINYEAFRLKQQLTENYTVLTPNARNGIYTYSNGTTANLLSVMGVQQNSIMQGLLAKVPTAYNNFNAGDSSAALLRNTAGYQFNVRDNRTRDNITGSFDYNLSSRNALHMALIYSRDILDRPDCDTTFDTVPNCANDDATRFLSLSWRTNPTPSITNTASFGFNLAPALFVAAPPSLPFFVSGTSYTNPVNSFLSQGRYTNTYNYADNAYWIHGNHTVRFGFQGEKVTIRSYNYASIVPSYALGFGSGNTGLVSSQLPGITSSDLSSANTLLATLGGYLNTDTQLFNVSTRTSGYVNGAPNLRNWYFDNYAGYVSDNWRIKHNLTASLGLRWDYYTPVDEKDALVLLPVINSGSNAINTLLDPNATLNFAGSAVGRSWYNPSKHQFAPNLGLAWALGQDSKTVIRAGYSIQYVDDNLGQTLSNSVTTNSGLSTTVSNTGLTGFVSNNPPAITAPTFSVPRTVAANYAINSSNATAMPDPTMTTPYVQQWNIGVERAVKGMILDVRYVGNHGVKEIRGLDYNQVLINQLLPNFQIVQNNGLLAMKQGLAFSPAYNANVPGSQPIPAFFNNMPNGGYLTNSSVISYIQTGQVGELGNFYQTNRINGPYNFYANPNTLGANLLQNFSTSTYNALVLEATRRFNNGFGFQANYVFSKVLSDSQNNQQTSFEPLLDMHNAKIEKARVAGMDNTHVFKANFNYALPLGKGHKLNGNRIVNKVIGDWTVAGIYTFETGTPFSILSVRGTLNRAGRSTWNTVNTTLTQSQLNDLFQTRMTGNGPYVAAASVIGSDGRAVAGDGLAPFTGQVFTEPVAGGLGSLQRASMNGPSVWDFDFKVAKTIRVTERESVEIRMDSTNFLNHTTWYVGDQTVTSTTFGKITSQYYGNRLIQFSAYLRF